MADATTSAALISGASALLGALVGGGVTVAAEVLRTRGTRAERERERRLALDLQRQTLMDLQDATTTWVLTVGEIVYASDVPAERLDELVRRERVERLQAMRLIDRVRDDATRNRTLDVFQVGFEAQAGPGTAEESRARLMDLQVEAARLNEQIGVELRRYL